MVDYSLNLKHYGYLGASNAFDRVLQQRDSLTYKNSITYLEYSDVFTFEFPDEETAMYFVLKFNPEIINEEN